MNKRVYLSVIASLFLLLMMLFLSGCNVRNPERDKEKVFKIVTENESMLRESVASSDYSNARQIEGIESIHRSKGAVDFSCGGYGFGSSTAYYGFCYVANNDYHKIPFAEYISEGETVVDGNRIAYKQKDGDNAWNAEMIVDGFWYYDASF